MVQKGLKSGVLVTWTKSFACPDGVGEDAVKLLEEAIARRQVQRQIIVSSLPRLPQFNRKHGCIGD